MEWQISRHGAALLERRWRTCYPNLPPGSAAAAICIKATGGKPSASINFITCHDGFTLHDLVSYNEKHNEANGEDNHDGANDNNSWNCGAEGPTDDPAINALRWQQKRNFITTLLLSQGVPMLLAGDELSHTQQGNNNAYCQDNELTWLNWELLTDEQQDFYDFVRTVVQIQHTQPVFQRRKFFQGRPIRGEGILDISWFEPSGEEMTEEAWNTGYARCLGVRWAGDLIGETDERGEPVVGDTVLLLMNAHHEAIPFTLPPLKEAQQWERLLDTAEGSASPLAGGRSAAVCVTRPFDGRPAHPGATGGGTATRGDSHRGRALTLGMLLPPHERRSGRKRDPADRLRALRGGMAHGERCGLMWTDHATLTPTAFTFYSRKHPTHGRDTDPRAAAQ